MRATRFKKSWADSYTQHYKRSTPSRKGRLDTCLFAVGSHKPCLSIGRYAILAGAFARHGIRQHTYARTHGGQDVEQ